MAMRKNSDDKHAHLVQSASDSFTKEEWAVAKKVLATLVKEGESLSCVSKSEQEELQYLAGRAATLDKGERRKLRRARKRKDVEKTRLLDDEARKKTQLRREREAPVFVTPPATSAFPIEENTEQERPRFEEDHMCYVCKSAYREVHSFYDQLCPPCGDFNFSKRMPRHDLSGRVALLTGARVKIGYHAAILLLRNGARVIVTTRFPKDAAARYAAEEDYDVWSSRLSVYGLDLRHTPSVEVFCSHLLQTLPRLDFIIHNACQTLKRPPAFYAHLQEGERKSLAELPDAERFLVEENEKLLAQKALPDAPSLSQIDTDSKRLPEAAAQTLFPAGMLDADLQQVDLRAHNSWRLTLDEVPTTELLEVMLVNAVAPFVISGKLRPLMKKTPGREKHIVNVSAMEGQFNRHKTARHPHTNMAKAALNMLTRTSAQDYVKDGIFMNAVDTGWVTDEDPAHLTKMKEEEHFFSPPLDIVDGAARIVDPIFSGLQSGEHVRGRFLKDYKPTYW